MVRFVHEVARCITVVLPIGSRGTCCHNLYCFMGGGSIVFYCTAQWSEYIFTLLLLLLYTRWFKYDRNKLWLVYTQIVPVISEPPCKLCTVLGISLHITVLVVTVEKPARSCCSCVVCICRVSGYGMHYRSKYRLCSGPPTVDSHLYEGTGLQN